MKRIPIAKSGDYTLYLGKLDPSDARSHYVTGPTSGRIAPLASFWDEGSGIRWLREHSAEPVKLIASPL